MNDNESDIWQYLILFALIALGLAGFFFLNSTFLVGRFALTDFVLNWNSLQRFIYDGFSPYSAEIYANSTRLIIQQGGVTEGLRNLHLPLWNLLLMLPFSWIQDLGIAGSIWLMLLEFSLAGVVLLSLMKMERKESWFFTLILVVFFLVWQPFYASINTGSEVLLQVFLLLLSLYMVEKQSDEYAGVLIALAFFNFEIFGILFFTYFLWLLGNQRGGVLGGFVLTVLLLIVLSFLFSNNWYLEYLKNQLSFWGSNDLTTTALLFEGWLPAIGKMMSYILAVLALATLLFEWQNIAKREAAGLMWVLSLCLPMVPLLGISYRPEWLIATMPALILVFTRFIGRWRILGFILVLFLMFVIGSGLWLAKIYNLPSIFLFFYPLLTVILLYWVRWDAVKKPRLWVDQLALKE
jgi:hypothetical protein